MAISGGRGGRPDGKLKRTVRGESVEDGYGPVYQRRATELYLIREGFSLRDIRGTRARGVSTTAPSDRTDIEAVVGRLTAPTARRIGLGAVALGVLLSVETGVISPTVLSLAVAVAIRYLARLDLGDEPVAETYETRERGLTDREALDYLTMSNEITKMKQEQRENAREKMRRKNKRRRS